MKPAFALILLAALVACTTSAANPYESASSSEVALFKRLPIPLPKGSRTTVRQGAFGKSSHNETGNQYNWDFEVPFGTSVIAAEGGIVNEVWLPTGGGGCDAKYTDNAHNLKIGHADGTVAQYMHIEPTVKSGDRVMKGQVIAHTALNGWVCYPHVHFGVYASKNNLYSSPDRKTVPIFFEGIPGGIARAGEFYVVP